MAATPSNTTVMKFTEARQQFSQVVNRVARREGRVLIEKHGIPVAAVVSADDLEQLDRLDQERAKSFEGLSRISRAFADVPIEELEREVERSIRESREKAREERAKVAASR